MTGDSQPFRYRESVQAYFESPEVRFAVDQLLARKMSFIPEAFTSNEVADFYKACLAARQTQIDFAQDMFDLWHRIWPELGAGWQPVPYDPADEELSLDPQVRWEEGYFQRNFLLRGTGITAGMWLFLRPSAPSGSEIELGCFLTQGNRTLFKKSNVTHGWSWEKENEYFEFSNDVVVSQTGLDLTSLRAAAQLAVNLIEKLASP